MNESKRKQRGIILTMIRKLLHNIALIFGVCEAYRQHVDDGLVDFSGQGRDRYGR